MALTEPARVESPHEQADGYKKPKSKRPANTAFRQQRLKAWQPILTPKSVLPLFFVVGIIFAPLGGVLLWASSEVQELVIDYSQCREKAPLKPSDPEAIPAVNVMASFKSSKQMSPATWQLSREGGKDICSLWFDIPNDIGPPVYMYYRLTNFYQNHRRYVQSMSLDQLMGKAVPNGTIKGGLCEPLAVDEETGKAYYPCGLIANSLFNDTISSPVFVNHKDDGYFMTDEGIAWDSDRELIQNTEYKPWEVVPPPFWRERYGDHYTEESLPRLHEDEAFMVWMKTAGLPDFSKLSRRNDTAPMRAGIYRLDIGLNFPVTEYDGTKSILISTRTVVGGKNPFMGIAYLVVGGFSIVLGTLFAIAHLIKPRKLGDHAYLTWNNEQPSTAIATGRDDRLR